MLNKTLGVYSVFDVEAKFFDVPFFCHNDIFASRRFIGDVRSGGKSMVSSFKDQFELWYLGDFDVEQGNFEIKLRMVLAGKAVEVI